MMVASLGRESEPGGEARSLLCPLTTPFPSHPSTHIRSFASLTEILLRSSTRIAPTPFSCNPRLSLPSPHPSPTIDHPVREWREDGVGGVFTGVGIVAFCGLRVQSEMPCVREDVVCVCQLHLPESSRMYEPRR